MNEHRDINKTEYIMKDLLNKYSQEIKELAIYAKANDFDIETGDIDELMKEWIKSRKGLYDEDNKEAIKQTVKFMVG